MEGRDELDECHSLAPGKSRQLFTKGKQVYVEGRLQTRSYDDKDGKKVYATDVIAEDILLLGGRGDAGPAEEGSGMASRPRAQAQRPRPSASAPDEPPEMGITDDDVPF